MSDGHYCVVRDLGLVKGGKGMRHHEVIIDFNRRGMIQLFKRALARLRKPRHQATGAELVDLPGRQISQVHISHVAPAVRSSR